MFRWLTLWAVALSVVAQEPTLENVRYGPAERNVFDFWQARSELPAPVIVYIHGGGFRNGDKAGIRKSAVLRGALESGVSFASINYRFLGTAPIQEILRDAARAIQFIRSKAKEWNVDTGRIAAFGGSAGAGTSLWLAFHDDLADPRSEDPVLRESSRLRAAGALATQFSYDLSQWTAAVLGAPYEKFLTESLELVYGRPADLAAVRADVDMRGLITKDDPPVYLHSPQKGGTPTTRGEYNHHPAHARAIKRRCDEAGVKAVLYVPGDGGDAPPDGNDRALLAFLLDALRR